MDCNQLSMIVNGLSLDCHWIVNCCQWIGFTTTNGLSMDCNQLSMIVNGLSMDFNQLSMVVNGLSWMDCKWIVNKL
jgi:hypothetical protein